MVEEDSSEFTMLKVGRDRWWDLAFVSEMRIDEGEASSSRRLPAQTVARSRGIRVLVMDYFIGCNQLMTVPQVRRCGTVDAASGIAWLK